MSNGPVVVCVLSRLGLDPAAVAPLASRVVLTPESADALSYGLGTGITRPDVVGALAARARSGTLLEGPAVSAIVEHADYERGEAADFFTETAVPRCSVHLIVRLADVVGGGDRALVALGSVEELAARELPVRVHAIVDTADPSVVTALSSIAGRLGNNGLIATIAGGELAFGEDVNAPGLLEVFRAIVLGYEGQSLDDPAFAIGEALREPVTASAMPATRVGKYRGARGSLEADFGSGAPTWTWRSEDVVIVAASEPRRLAGLTRLLVGAGLPEEVASKIALRGRAVEAFHPGRVAALSPIGPLPVAASVDTAARASLLERAAAAGKRCATIVDRDHVVLGTFTFDGDRELPAALGIERHVDEAPIDAAVKLVRSATKDVVVVTATAPRVGPDGDLEELFRAVAERKGAIIVAAREPPVALVAGVDPAPFADTATTTATDWFGVAAARLGVDVNS